MTPSVPRWRIEAWALSCLALALPFEARRPTLDLAGLRFTSLEIAAGAAMLALAVALRGRLPSVLARPPLPVASLACFALAHLMSAALAPAGRQAALVYSLRIAVATVMALLVSACDTRASRACLRALTAAASLVAALAVLEALGLQGLDGFLDRFRAAPFLVGEARRATATTENPNLAAALLGCGLVAAAGLSGVDRHAPRRAGVLALLLSAGLLCTYSRGGLLAAALGLGTVLAVRRASRAAPAAVLCVVAACAAVFAVVSPAFRGRLALEERLSTYRALYTPLESSLALAPGEARTLSIRVTNTGSGAWRPEQGFRLSCTWYSSGRLRDAGCRTPLSEPLDPGASVTLTADVRAPDTTGRYLLVWEMRGELGRFAGLGVPPATVPAAVGEAPGIEPPALPTLLSDQSRTQLWRLAYAMWTERPLLGFGPDSFRRMHASYAGWPFEDDVRSAHNTFLEMAATTGALGLLALIATLVTSAAAAARMLREPDAGDVAAVLLGLLVSITAHACVDHLLGFTAQYLMLGVVAGAAAAAPGATSPSPGS